MGNDPLTSGPESLPRFRTSETTSRGQIPRGLDGAGGRARGFGSSPSSLSPVSAGGTNPGFTTFATRWVTFDCLTNVSEPRLITRKYFSKGGVLARPSVSVDGVELSGANLGSVFSS